VLVTACCLPASPSPAMAAGSNMTIGEEDIRASILSAVEDKMRRRLREVFQQAQVILYWEFLLEELHNLLVYGWEKLELKLFCSELLLVLQLRMKILLYYLK